MDKCILITHNCVLNKRQSYSFSRDPSSRRAGLHVHDPQVTCTCVFGKWLSVSTSDSTKSFLSPVPLHTSGATTFSDPNRLPSHLARGQSYQPSRTLVFLRGIMPRSSLRTILTSCCACLHTSDNHRLEGQMLRPYTSLLLS